MTIQWREVGQTAENWTSDVGLHSILESRKVGLQNCAYSLKLLIKCTSPPIATATKDRRVICHYFSRIFLFLSFLGSYASSLFHISWIWYVWILTSANIPAEGIEKLRFKLNKGLVRAEKNWQRNRHLIFGGFHK